METRTLNVFIFKTLLITEVIAMAYYEIRVIMNSGEQIFVISEREIHEFIINAKKFGWVIVIG